MSITRKPAILVAMSIALAVAIAFTAAPVHALDITTGDDPILTTADKVSAGDLPELTADEAAFEAFSDERDEELAALGTTTSIEPLLMDAPWAYLYTPSHRQERSYWCGPASCQIVTHYWGKLLSQSTFAQFMHTSTSGTDFSLVDDALRKYSGKSYFYVSGITTFSAFMRQCEYGIGQKRYPIVVDVRILGDEWPNYEFDHAGHILPVEGFDERYAPYRVRVNDPYDEAYFAGGGSTYGHQMYPASVVARGVNLHWRHAVVR